MMEEIPVYLFTGFLDAGKTKFIQETLEDVRFNNGESTLLLLCEEGEEEYEPTTFSGKNVFIEVIEDPSELTPINLERLQKKHAVERVIVEYNGMWMLDQLYQNMPEAWIVYQEFMFAQCRQNRCSSACSFSSEPMTHRRPVKPAGPRRIFCSPGT